MLTFEKLCLVAEELPDGLNSKNVLCMLYCVWEEKPVPSPGYHLVHSTLLDSKTLPTYKDTDIGNWYTRIFLCTLLGLTYSRHLFLLQ